MLKIARFLTHNTATFIHLANVTLIQTQGKNSKVFRDPSPERFHDVRELLAQDQLQQADNLRHTLEQADRAADDVHNISYCE